MIDKIVKLFGRKPKESSCDKVRVDLLCGDLGKEVYKRYQEKVDSYCKDSNSLRYRLGKSDDRFKDTIEIVFENDIVRGSSDLAVIIMNEILNDYGLRTVNLSEIQRMRKEGFVSDSLNNEMLKDKVMDVAFMVSEFDRDRETDGLVRYIFGKDIYEKRSKVWIPVRAESTAGGNVSYGSSRFNKNLRNICFFSLSDLRLVPGKTEINEGEVAYVITKKNRTKHYTVQNLRPNDAECDIYSSKASYLEGYYSDNEIDFKTGLPLNVTREKRYTRKRYIALRENIHRVEFYWNSGEISTSDLGRWTSYKDYNLMLVTKK